jgi:hypothetical protein
MLIENLNELDVLVHAYNPSNGEAEPGGLRVLGRSGLYSKTLSQNNNNNNK